MTDQEKNPITDDERIQELFRLKLQEEQVDEILNEYVNKATEQFNLPIGLVSIVLDSAQKFAASIGLGGWLKEANGTPVEWSFCANSVKSREPFIVENAEEHDAVKGNPLVTEDGVRCYAGVPMITSKGHVIGNFCVIGTESREFSEQEIEQLRNYARLAVERIEARVS